MHEPPDESRKISGFVTRFRPQLVICICNPADHFSPLLHRRLAAELERAGISTRFLQLLTSEEQRDDTASSAVRLDVPSLSARIAAAIDTACAAEEHVQIGLFASSSCTAPCLAAAAARGDKIRAVVSLEGRPDLAVFALAALRAPTLLLVRGIDETSRHFAEITATHLRGRHEVHVLPKLQGRFQESGEQDLVCALATSWFVEALGEQKGQQPANRA